MSVVVLAVQDVVGQVLAQQGNPVPEAPPGSDTPLQLVRYLRWLPVIAVPIVLAIVVIVLVRVSRSGRGPAMDARTGRPLPPAHPDQRWAPPPTDRPIGPGSARQGVDGWGSPDSAGRGRPDRG
ncbi:hypothetical protein ACFXK0_06635 [Nocardia sp. NPDC059177]|uniref:hypothetical protein n=1 Tax=Nocardia sp. NPDC059177 TaxID=3346759 RepID=UPI00369ED0A0